MEDATTTYAEIRAIEQRVLRAMNAREDDDDDDDDGDGRSRRVVVVREAREDMHRVRALIEELREISEELDGDERRRVCDMVREREMALESTRSIVRQAVVEAASASQRREEAAREALLTGSDGCSKLDAIKAGGAVSISSEATEGLRRARQMMATELEKGENTLAALTESTATMEKTGEEYGNQTIKLNSGRRLIQTIERQTFLDSIILWTGFTFFVLVVVHILWKRTPVLARFHPLYYTWAKTKALDVTDDHIAADVYASQEAISLETAIPESVFDAAIESLEDEPNPYAIPSHPNVAQEDAWASIKQEL
jgi:protein transport protein SEC20